ncbi:homocysteine S-methyltransferase [Nasonia vitripennis]|uniref:Hcy-binding domain-containing protein n=1 Tax=Nasonia vitripennis TaxID=7425 RepID=A0A7M7G745_NASVI|nr:homocysteine S-methyltransferase [Nasonia vitripennis]
MTSDVKVIDGGFSTQLVTHVGEVIDGDPLWTSRFLYSNPDAVFQTHLDYLRAGSHVIETATYQASIPGYVKYLDRTEEEALQLIKTAVELAKKAVRVYKEEIKGKDVSNPEPMVAGSIGPYAAYLHDCSEYTGGSYANIESMDSIVEWHRPRFEALINGGVDLLAIETIPCAREAEALVGLLKQYPDTKAWLSFSCKVDGKSIADGSSFKQTVLKCYKAASGQIVACGVNCLAPRSVTPLLKSINEKEINQFIPMVAYPNSGEKYSSTTFSWTIDNDFHPPEEFVKDWLDIGVRYIGSCCRTGSKDIERIAAEVKSWTKSRLT